MTTPTLTSPAAAALNVAAALAAAGFAAPEIAAALVDPAVYPTLTATELARVLHDARVAPTLDATAVAAALTGTNHYQPADVTAAIAAVFPPPPVAVLDSNQAFATKSGASLSAARNAAYDFGTGDFTVEAAVRATRPGTVLARKGTAGGRGNGGFLVVIKAGGTLKFATDNGFGFYEVTAASAALDGKWHHLAAVRTGPTLSLYLDGKKLVTAPNGNAAAAPLNVSNNLAVTLGTTEQRQERFRALPGQLAEVRLWSGARSAALIRRYMWARLPPGTAGLVGRWSGEFGRPVDRSATRSVTTLAGPVATVVGPPSLVVPTPVSPYAGVYDTLMHTGTGAGDASWTALGTLTLFPDGTVALNDRALAPTPPLHDGTLTWPAEAAAGIGAGTVTFQPSGTDTRYWSTPSATGPVLQGTYTHPGTSAPVDLRGTRRP